MTNLQENNGEENIGSFYMGKARSEGPKRRLPSGLLTTLVLLSFAGIIWYAYPRGAEKYVNVDIPVVKADTAPIKEVPKDPGGMEVPHQDSTVFNSLAGKQPSEVEKLLPATEEPMNKMEAVKDAGSKKPPVVDKAAPQMNLDMQTKDVKENVASTTPPSLSVAKEDEADDDTDAADAVVPDHPQKEAKPAPAVASGSRYIQLGSYRTAEGAKKDWSRLQAKYPSYFGKLHMKTQKIDLPGKGTFYRLQAGTVSTERAKEICKPLKKENAGGCILVK